MAVDAAAIIIELLKVAGKPAVERSLRSPRVLALLKRFHLDPTRPPKDFDAIYAIAVVESCWGAPEPIIRFFEHEDFRAACRKSFESGDYSILRKAADALFEWNSETHSLGWIDYDPRRDIATFLVTFDEIVSRARDAIEVRSELLDETRHDQVTEGLSKILEQVERLESVTHIREQVARDLDPTTSLNVEFLSQVREWLVSVGHQFETFEESSEDDVKLISRIQVRGARYDRILIVVMYGEIASSDVAAALDKVAQLGLDEAWLVSERRVSSGAREVCQPGKVQCFTFDELIEIDADFEPYLEWLDSEIQRLDIQSRYIPLSCTKEDVDVSGRVLSTSRYAEQQGWIDGYVDVWLQDSSKEHLSILGEFGMGKSWFCLHYAKRLADDYRLARSRGLARPRIPLVIPLRDYSKAVNIESLFSEFFFRRHELQVPGYRCFEQLNRMGRLLLIFDGFDEMAARVDRQGMVNNFWELARAVVPGSKVILTCRTEHFPEARDSREILSAQLKASTAALIVESPKFEILELEAWTKEQVALMLSQVTSDGSVQLILENRELLDLMRRPVMSDLILDALPEISSGEPVDLTRVYFYAVRRKMARDISDERTFTSMSDKVYFLSEVSWKMLAEDSMTLNYKDFPAVLRQCFGETVKRTSELDHWHHDMAGQTILIRNAAGDYFPAHKSLIEFFVAYKLTAQLGLLNDDFLQLMNDGIDAATEITSTWSKFFADNSPDARRRMRLGRLDLDSDALGESLGTQRLLEPVPSMMRAMMRTDGLEVLVQLLEKTCQGGDEPSRLGANLVDLVLGWDDASLRGRDLTGTGLAGALFDVGPGGAADLSGTVFDGADCSGADFERAILRDASFVAARLDGAKYIGVTNQQMEAVHVSSDGKLIVAVSPGRLWRWQSGDPTPTSAPWPPAGRVGEVEISPDGRFAIVETAANGLGLWNLHSDSVTHLPDYSGAIFVPDIENGVVQSLLGRKRGRDDDGDVSTSEWGGTLDLIDIATGDVLAEIDPGMRPVVGRYSPTLGKSVLAEYMRDSRHIRFKTVFTRAANGNTQVTIEDMNPWCLRDAGPVDEERVIWGLSEEGAWFLQETPDQPSDGVVFRAESLSFSRGDTGEFELPARAFGHRGLDRSIVTQSAILVPAATPDGIVFVLPGGLQRWALGRPDKQLMWDVEVVGLSDARVNGNHVILSTRYGDLTLLSGLDGTVERSCNVVEDMHGANFTSASGLSDKLKGLLVRQGAIV